MSAQAPDTSFKLAAKAGFIIFDRRDKKDTATKPRYFVLEDDVDDIIDFINRRPNAPGELRAAGLDGSRIHRSRLLVGINVIAFVSLVGLMMYRKRKHMSD